MMIEVHFLSILGEWGRLTPHDASSIDNEESHLHMNLAHWSVSNYMLPQNM